MFLPIGVEQLSVQAFVVQSEGIMVKSTVLTKLQVGDRVKLVRGSLRGHTATIAQVNQEGYWLIGDWTRQTGFTRVPYGPIAREALEKLEERSLNAS